MRLDDALMCIVIITRGHITCCCRRSKLTKASVTAFIAIAVLLETEVGALVSPTLPRWWQWLRDGPYYGLSPSFACKSGRVHLRDRLGT